MTPTHIKAKSLAGKIFTTVVVFTVVVVIVLGFVLTSIFYVSDEQHEESRLVERVNNAAAVLNDISPDEGVEVLDNQFDSMVRYTLLADDGTVLFDSAADASTLENHSSRPEVEQAVSQGEAVSIRYSETLQTDTIYAAVQLDDGRVIRISEDRRSFVAFIGDMLAPVLVALVIASATVFVLSRFLTKRIMKPIDALDFVDPLDNDIYVEMDPLLVRIDEQQRQLIQQNEELALAENMRRDFSSNVSHEMKTPLQVISGYAELMKNDMIEPEDRQHFAELIYDEAQAMRSLINDVLTLSMLDESALGENRAEVNVLAVVERVAGRIESLAEKREVSVSYSGVPAKIFGNETLVEEMIYNLVENGIRYNHPGGQVAVRVVREVAYSDADDGSGASAVRQARYARVNGTTPEAMRERHEVVVRVSDTGPGIPEELHEKIFERFFRMEKSRSKETGGTGLGLAIVKHAVLYHGGSIQVESEEGKGTSFVLHLPDADQD